MAVRGKAVVVVRAGSRAGRVLSWCRALLPAAVLLVAPLSPPVPEAEDAIVLDADEIDSPLALAHAITRATQRWGRD